MALKDEVLQNFFKVVTSKQERHLTQKSGNRRRVFDEPSMLFDELSDLESGDKVETNRRQSGDKLKTEPKTEWRQTKDKLKTEKKKLETKVETQPETKVETNQRQTRDKPVVSERKNVTAVKAVDPNNVSFSTLSGSQRRILLSIYKYCSLSSNLETNPLSIENIAYNSNASIPTSKKTLQRLEKLGYIRRCSFKNGRGGWTIYSMDKTLFQEIRLSSENLNQRQSGDKLETQLETKVETQLETGPSYSSSNLNINSNNTTTEGSVLPGEWVDINYSELAGIRFSSSHIKQIFNKGLLSAKEVQASIDALAFDIRVNQKDKQIKVDMLRYFLGILIRGSVYNPPSNYVDPVEESLKKYHESQKNLSSKVENALLGIKQQEFSKWSDSLSEQEHDNFVPEDMKKGGLIPKAAIASAKKREMEAYFNEIIWPKVKQDLNEQVPGLSKFEKEST